MHLLTPTDTIAAVLAEALERGQLSADLSIRASAALRALMRPTVRWQCRQVLRRTGGLAARIHTIDGALIEVDTPALYAAWRVFSGVRPVLACQHSDAQAADVSLRRSLRETADALELVSRDAANAVRCLRIVGGEVLIDRRRRAAPDVVTD